jgi:large subunit ribosomal protein L10
MTREDKTAIIEELREKFVQSPFFYICDAAGMTVAQTNNFRRLCFERGVEYRVIKNTLIKKALETSDTDYSTFEGTVLKGFSGVLFHADNAKAPAKLLKEFYKGGPKIPVLKGASVDSSIFIGADQLETLIALKSRQELIGEVVGLLQSPAKNVISALKGQGGKIAGILKTLSERGEEQQAA